jgi:CPA2 family monovalent cation:H+ antiporter-2
MDSVTLTIVILFVSLLFNIPLSKLKIPPILGYIFTGILIISFVDVKKETIEHIAEFGVIFLMFMIGLEFSFDKLKSMKKEVFLFGALEMTIVSVVFGSLIMFFTNSSFKFSLILGSALALSSTAIVLKLLNENREISKPYGKATLGILLFQDIAVIPVLVMISILTNKNANIGDLLLATLNDVFIVLTIIIIAGKYIIPHIIKLASKTKSDEIFIATILLIVISSAQIAHYFNLSYTLGAFIAGMMISETKYKYQIEANLIPFRDILLGLFFVSIGLLINIEYTLSHFMEILFLTILIMSVKSTIIYLILRGFTPNRVSIKTGVVLSQVGEFSFVIFALMSINHLGDNEIIQKLIISAVLSMLATPFLIKYLYKIVDVFDNKTLDFENYSLKSAEVSGHIIIVGYDEIGQRICQKLKKENLNYVVIDKHLENAKQGLENGDNIILGNASDKYILNHLNIQEASSIIITTKNVEKTVLISENILNINQNLNIIALASSKNQKELFKSHNIKYVIDESKELANKLLEFSLKCELYKKKEK